jgi:cathepsin L
MPGAGRLSTLQVPSRPSKVEDLPAAFGWQGKLNATSSVLDQGACGSCWAVSSVAALRAHSELFQRYRHFSIQQVVSCAPNPHKCGGSGGCQGATAEIAMDYAAKVGLLTEDEFPYSEKDGECPSEIQMPDKDALDADSAGTVASLVGYSESAKLGMDAKPGMDTKSGLVGFHKLTTNKFADVMLSIHNAGPAVVSISAGGGWGMYSSGVYDGCRAGDTINHAVVLIGYGKDKQSGLKFWHIQNSWGDGWGENGFMRMSRLDTQDAEEANCGWDLDPLQGSGCEGGPSKVWTCGSCGILFDVVVPRFSESEHGWWAKHGGAAD